MEQTIHNLHTLSNPQQQLTQEEQAQAEHVAGAAALARRLLGAAVQRIRFAGAAAGCAFLLLSQALLRDLQAGGPQAQQRLLLQVRRLHHVHRGGEHALPLLQAGAGGSGAAQDQLLHAGAAGRLLRLLDRGLRRLLHILRRQHRLLLLLLLAMRLLGGGRRRHRCHGRCRFGGQLRHSGACAALAPHVLPDVLHLLLGHLITEEVGRGGVIGWTLHGWLPLHNTYSSATASLPPCPTS